MRATVGECHRRMQNNSKYSPTGVWWVKTSVVLINYRYCRIGGNFLTLKLHLKRIPNVWFDWIFKKKKKRKIFTHAWTSKFRYNMIVAQKRLPAFWRHIGVEKFNFCLKVRLALLFPNYLKLPVADTSTGLGYQWAFLLSWGGETLRWCSTIHTRCSCTFEHCILIGVSF